MGTIGIVVLDVPRPTTTAVVGTAGAAVVEHAMCTTGRSTAVARTTTTVNTAVTTAVHRHTVGAREGIRQGRVGALGITCTNVMPRHTDTVVPQTGGIASTVVIGVVVLHIVGVLGVGQGTSNIVQATTGTGVT